MFKALRGLLTAAVVALSAAAAAGPQSWDESWDGTWAGGFDTENGAQVIVVGEKAIGLYWHDDYVLGLISSVAADGTLTLESTGTKARTISGNNVGW